MGSRLMILGGWTGAERTSLATYFDMETETFGQVESMPQERCCGASGVIDDRIYVVGGFCHQWGTPVGPDDITACTPVWGYPFCVDPIPGDTNEDCYINMKDFVIIANNWLKCNDPFDADCY